MTKFWHRATLASILLFGSMAHTTAYSAPKDVPRGTLGQFDFYALSLSWSPAYCATARTTPDNQSQCAAQKPFGFIVHGLWPQYKTGSWPQYCLSNVAAPSAADVANVQEIIPSSKLQNHEWKKHGTCVTNSAGDYFTLVKKAYDSLQIPAMFNVPQQPFFRTVAAMEQAFTAKNPQMPRDSLQFICNRSGKVLREVRVCMDKDLKAISCPAPAKTSCSPNSTIRVTAPSNL